MKLHYLDITLDEGKELVGVRTNGNTITIVYQHTQEVRPIGFIHYQEEESEDVGSDKGQADKHIPVVATGLE